MYRISRKYPQSAPFVWTIFPCLIHRGLESRTVEVVVMKKNLNPLATARIIQSSVIGNSMLPVYHLCAFFTDEQNSNCRLNDKMLNLDLPVEIQFRGQSLFQREVRLAKTVIEKTVAGRSDYTGICSAEVIVDVPLTD